MYKFPITKDNMEYAVAIVKDELYIAGYKVTLYKKKRFLCFNIDIPLLTELFVFESDDEFYLKQIKNMTLYKTMTIQTIDNYVMKNLVNDFLYQTEKSFNDWDGRIY